MQGGSDIARETKVIPGAIGVQTWSKKFFENQERSFMTVSSQLYGFHHF